MTLCLFSLAALLALCVDKLHPVKKARCRVRVRRSSLFKAIPFLAEAVGTLQGSTLYKVSTF